MLKPGHMVADTVKIQILSKEFLLSDLDYVKKRCDLHCFRYKNPVCGLDYKAIFGIAAVCNRIRMSLFIDKQRQINGMLRASPEAKEWRPMNRTDTRRIC